MRTFLRSLASILIVLLMDTLYTEVEAQQVYVNECAIRSGNGSRADPFNRLSRAVMQAAAGSTLLIQYGSYAETLTIQKPLTLTASGGGIQIGEYYVGRQETCIPIDPLAFGLDFQFSFNCGSPAGVRAEIYYPAATAEGSSVACEKPFPLVLYAHGKRFASRIFHLCDPAEDPGPIDEDYRQLSGILEPLAAIGVVVISVDLTSASFDDFVSKAGIILNALAFVQNENGRSGSLLGGAVDLRRVGFAGHSSGGGATILAAACLRKSEFSDERLNAICSPVNGLHLDALRPAAMALLAPGLDSMFLPIVPRVEAPTLIVYGTSDTQQVGESPLDVYGLASQPKHLLVVTGANHYGYTDRICIASPNDNPSTVGGSIGLEARVRQQQTARNYVRVFFSGTLIGNEALLDYILQQGSQQCGNTGDPPACGNPRRLFQDLTRLNVSVKVCSCAP